MESERARERESSTTEIDFTVIVCLENGNEKVKETKN